MKNCNLRGERVHVITLCWRDSQLFVNISYVKEARVCLTKRISTARLPAVLKHGESKIISGVALCYYSSSEQGSPS